MDEVVDFAEEPYCFSEGGIPVFECGFSVEVPFAGVGVVFFDHGGRFGHLGCWRQFGFGCFLAR